MTIVGIGASAGGIEAFRGFFGAMPADSGMAFVVVLHLPPDHKSLLPEILSRYTAMTVEEVTEHTRVRPNHVYVPPSGYILTFREGRLHLQKPPPEEKREPIPISLFFDSLGATLGEDAIGIVLSGTGNDGALGLKAIKTCGGLTLAQGSDGTGPLFGGMPDNAIATGAVDLVASVEDMPRRILAYEEARRARQREGEPDGQAAEQMDRARLTVCGILHRQLGHDFSGYKDKTFLRRVQRRMQVLSLVRLDDYIARLSEDRGEVLMLFRDLLIGVTSFFRDAETFDALKRDVVPKLFAGKRADSSVRAWVAGCATGEEAYSIAILLREYLETMTVGPPRLVVFATDIDEAAIGTARAGRYPATLLQGLSPERLARFFVPGVDGTYTVAKEIREICTFSSHSLTRDPPFSRIDLVSCRNLLIYMDTDLQAVVIPAFHYALVPHGFMLLGSAEAVSRHENLFSVVDRAHRIFRRRDAASPTLQMMTGTVHPLTQSQSDGLPGRGVVPRRSNLKATSRANARVLERFGPAFVVVTADGEIVQFSHRVGRFLEPAPGAPNQNVLDMARSGLRLELRSALKQAVDSGRSVETALVSVAMAGEGNQLVCLAVEPLFDAGEAPLYLVVFVEAARRLEVEPGGVVAEAGVDHRLESELRDTRERLQSITEEHESALEELRSSNEELHSVNEELQSTNEELETSKEEIQSINEELQTVNAQLSAKVDELDVKNSDLRNLFDSTEVATIFLDRYLIVRGFTPAVANIYNLIPSDLGRPLTDIVNRLRYTGLREDVQHVFNSLTPLERRVMRDDDTTHYLMRIQPYRTPDSKVGGTVVTFVDVTSIVQAEQHQRLLVDELNHRVKNMLTVVISLANQTIKRSDNLDDFAQTYLGRVHALTASYSLLSNEGWQTVKLREVLMQELRPFVDGNVRIAGPEVMLPPRSALALGMAIHELTTNAVKYGALSVPEGCIDVTWTVGTQDNDSAAGGEELTLDWVESGGPEVAPPTRRGFGMMLIERGLKQDMAAQVEVKFPPGGVHARVRAPLPPAAGKPPAVITS